MFEKIIKDKSVTRNADTSTFFNAANIISLSRIVLTIPAVWLFAVDKWVWGLIILGVCVISDWVDGFVARKMHLVSDIGKFIDPLADKIVAVGIMVVMIIKMDFPLWFLIVLVARDLSIFILTNLLYKRYHTIGGANITGKLFIFVLTIAAVLWIFEHYMSVILYAEIVLYIALGLMLISWIIYLVQNMKMMNYKEDKG